MAKKNDDDDEIERDVIVDLERLARLMRSASHTEGLMPAQWEALRYLARANRFSNSPGALTKYLGATKGTISQTLLTLEAKALVRKEGREDDERRVSLYLTPAGEAVLKTDPLLPLAKAIDDLGGKTRRRMAKGVSEILSAEVSRQKQPAFGTCRSCKHYRREGEAQPQCAALKASLDFGSLEQLCIHFEN